MEPRSILRLIGSLKFAAVILVLLCISMACATVYEAMHGTPAALIVFYRSRWFEVLLGLLAANMLASMLARFPWSRRHIGFLITHTSILLILCGAWVSREFGVDGQLSIAEGQAARQFTTAQEAFTARTPANDTPASLELGGGIGGIRAVQQPGLGSLTVGNARFSIEQYLPDSRRAERVLDDNPQPSCALEVSLFGPSQSSTAWAVAGEQPDPAELPIALRLATQPADVDRFLTAPATQPATARLVHLEIKGSGFDVPLERCLAGPVAVGQTSYTVHVLRYLPDAKVGEQGKIESASDQPNNPAIEAELAGPAGSFKRLAFAKFPDFGSMHGGPDTGEVKISFIAPDSASSSTPIEIVAGADARMAVRFSPDAGQPVTRELKVATPVDTPWPGLQFSVLRRFDHARREASVQAVDPPREDRQPAILVTAEAGQDHRSVWLRKDEPQTVALGAAQYELAYENKSVSLGFEVRLNKFQVGHYPGIPQPRSFESHVTFVDAAGTQRDCIISMNNPAKQGDYHLFQSSYQQSPNGPATSVLSVSWDPGQPIVFAGYFAMIAGMLYVLGLRMRGRTTEPSEEQSSAPGSGGRASRSPEAGKKPTARTTLLIVLGILGMLAIDSPHAMADAAKLPVSLDLSTVRAIPVQHDGRWMPLETLARDVVWSVTGDAGYRGVDPVLYLLAWTFDPQGWIDQPLITISSAELRRELKLPADQKVYSYLVLRQHKPLRKLMQDLGRRGERKKMDPLESKVSDISHKLMELQEAFGNGVIRVVPDATDAMGQWATIELPAEGKQPATPVETAWSELGNAFRAGNAASFTEASKRLAAILAELPAAHRPSPDRLAIEMRYNHLQPYSLAWKLMVLGAVLAAVGLGVGRRWMDAVVIIVLLAGFGVLTYGMWLRWQIAGQIPASNMFESLLFLSWGAGAFAIVAMLVMRDRSVPLTASAIGALALCLADTLPLDHFVRPIAPVLLDTVWMSIHVPGIMISYAVLALAALIAHGQIGAMALAPQERKLAETLDALHYWYAHVGTILLGAGIITGSMWAASSWGRYWGWDPKEVWSLIAFLAYLVILHVRVDGERPPVWLYLVAALLGAGLLVIVAPKLAPLSSLKILSLTAGVAISVMFVAVRGRFAMALKSAVAFWFIIMTYLGVNYVLGIGLHSYGFGTGAVVHYMLLTGSIDLLIVAVLTGVYLVRTRLAGAAAQPAAR